jgi:hypothetical protein
MTTHRLAALLLLGIAAWAADPPPEFSAAGLARGARPARMVVPGTFLTLYGQYLGPQPGQCSDSFPAPIYPTLFCRTQVLVGLTPAPLLYVSDKQINFKVPEDLPLNGTVDIRVIYNGQSSLPLTMKAGVEPTTVSLDGEAYTGMPVWIKIDLPSELEGSIRYPFILGSAYFGCNEVEVRRDGQPLPLLPVSDWTRFGVTIGGNICGSYALVRDVRGGRLPLHLLYRFDAPGAYEVRYTMRNVLFGVNAQTEIRARSEWTAIEILPARPNQRADWLQTVRDHPPGDAAELLAETLPSLLGVPDDTSLEILGGYLYHPDVNVRNFAMKGLFYWPDEAISRKLHTLLNTRGSSDVVADALSRLDPAK